LDRELEVRIDAAFAAYQRELKARLGATRERLRDGVAVMNRFFEHAERVAEEDAADADHAMRVVVEELRAKQLSRKQLAVLARVVSAKLAEAELAIEDARAVSGVAARELEEWTRLVSVAVQHERDDLAAAARGRVAHRRSVLSETDEVLREYLALHERLQQLARVLLEAAER
jgi:predicted metal-dependent phosphoesterase TrpH